MGTTNEPRKAVEVPVRIFGTDHDGKPFSENLTTVDVSVNGAKLRGLKARLEPDEIVGLTYGKTKSHFQVKWMGAAGTPTEGIIGLVNLNPTKPFWDFPLPALAPEGAEVTPTDERRRWPRIKCSVSLEIRPTKQMVIWGKAPDISQGGCFAEMSIPLPMGASLDIALWSGDAKLHLRGQVVSLQPGFGNGVSFIGNRPSRPGEVTPIYCDHSTT
ncbi:MAG: PilZ domain-containing protein [Terriglobales bacterium]